MDLRAGLQDVLTEPVAIRQGEKTRYVPSILAVFRVQLIKALKGDRAAMQAITKIVNEWDLLKDLKVAIDDIDSMLSDDFFESLGPEALEVLVKIEDEKEAIREAMRKKRTPN